MRHHRKLLRRLRALYPVTDRRGVIVERTPSGWRVVAGRVMAGRVMVGTRRGPVRMIDGGEDPRFVLRRMIIFASEDIGLADSRALEIAP